jgi:hypothetical protein
MQIPALIFGLLAGVAAPLAAQQADSAKASSDPVIQDNSFLVEEAYNQDAGVVQHIQTFQVERDRTTSPTRSRRNGRSNRSGIS